MTIKVSLDPNAVPPVTVNPDPFNVNNGNQTITWVPDANQNFAFSSLTGLPNPPFSNLNIQNGQVTVQDANGNGSAGTYTYAISVTANGHTYSSGPSPAPARAAVAAAPRILGGGQPSIKNN
jgi:hypothetical protein